MRVVAGEAKGRRLVQPPSEITRAATERIRESLFGILEPRIPDAAVLDLFAGAGTLGIEALSRGAARATFVDRDASAVAAIRANLAATGFDDRARVERSSVAAFLARPDTGGPYDIVFCDPPFREVRLLGAVLSDERLRAALAPGAVVVARHLRKHPPALPATAGVERAKEIGEETLLLLRYDADR